MPWAPRRSLAVNRFEAELGLSSTGKPYGPALEPDCSHVFHRSCVPSLAAHQDAVARAPLAVPLQSIYRGCESGSFT